MTDKASDGGGRAVLRLLKGLARAHAFAEIDERAGCVRVYNGASGGGDIVHHAPLEVWGRVEKAGYVELRDGAGGCIWHISAAGRDVVRTKNNARERGTPRAACASGDGARTGLSMRAPQQTDHESPLAWLHRRRDKSGEPLITDTQFQAGERLRADFEIAQLMPRLTVDWERAAMGGSRARPGAQHGLELGERASAARVRVNRALGAVGPELASVLVDVCCHLKGLEQFEKAAGWPQRSAKVVLQVALSALARHYGLDRRQPGDGRDGHGAAPVLHWGADGYRPVTTFCSKADGSS